MLQLLYFLLKLNNAAESSIRETYLSLLNFNELSDNAFYGVSFNLAVISASNMLSIIQAYFTFL